MGRRRRKQVRSERESAQVHAQGELLAIEPAALPPDESEPGSELNGARRELVLFELVEQAGGPVAAAEPAPEEQAVGDVQAVPEVDPSEVEASAPLCPPRCDESAHPERVLEQLEAARAATPDEVTVLVDLGWTLGQLGRFDEAERELRRAQKLAPDDVSVRAGLGVLCFRRGLYQQADAELGWVCEQDPGHGPAHFYRGEALNRLGRVDQALEVLACATRLQPTNHRAFYTMGILFDRKNLRDQAAAMYKKARELQAAAAERTAAGWKRR